MKIVFIDSKVPRKQAVGMHKGMGAYEKIAKDKLSSCQHCSALGTGHLKDIAAIAAGEAVFLAPLSKPGPSRSGYVERLFIRLDKSHAGLCEEQLELLFRRKSGCELCEDHLTEYQLPAQKMPVQKLL